MSAKKTSTGSSKGRVGRNSHVLTAVGQTKLGLEHPLSRGFTDMVVLEVKLKIKSQRGHYAKTLEKYGLTLDEYEAMVEDQGGKCAICGVTPKTRLCVDHCHATGIVRGLLCRSCNTAIGLLREDTKVMGKAIQYVRTWHRNAGKVSL